MARRKKSRRKGKRKATAAQMRGLRKAWAARKRKRKGKKSRPKKRRVKRRKSRKRSVASHMRSSRRRGFQPRSSGVASHYHTGSRGYAAGISSASKKRRRKVRSAKRYSKKHGGTVTAASIIKGARDKNLKAWVCVGRIRSGCGGGRKGGHVVGHLR